MRWGVRVYVCLLRSVVTDYACCHFFQNGSTPFHWAAANCHLDVVDELLSAGANINAADNVRTIIYIYIYIHYVFMLYLSVWGIQNGLTALLWAADLGHLEVVELLIARGADLQVVDGVSAFIWLSLTVLWEVGRGCSTLDGVFLLYIEMKLVVWC